MGGLQSKAAVATPLCTSAIPQPRQSFFRLIGRSHHFRLFTFLFCVSSSVGNGEFVPGLCPETAKRTHSVQKGREDIEKSCCWYTDHSDNDPLFFHASNCRPLRPPVLLNDLLDSSTIGQVSRWKLSYKKTMLPLCMSDPFPLDIHFYLPPFECGF